MKQRRFDDRFLNFVYLLLSVFYFLFVFNTSSTSSVFVQFLHVLLAFLPGLGFPYFRYCFSMIATSYEESMFKKISYTFFYSAVCLSVSFGGYMLLTEILFPLVMQNNPSDILSDIRWSIPCVAIGVFCIVVLYDFIFRTIVVFIRGLRSNKYTPVYKSVEERKFGVYNDWQSFVPFVFVCLILIGCIVLL